MTIAEKIIARDDGTEVRIVALSYVGRGLHLSTGVDVFHRNKGDANWTLCNDRPHPDWKTMSVDDYVKFGRSEKLQRATPGEILSVCSLLTQPSATGTLAS